MDRFHCARISSLRPGDDAPLEEREAHHLRVKRARVGDRVTLFDGTGAEATAEVLEGGRVRVVEVPADTETGTGTSTGTKGVEVTLAVAMPKGKRDLFLVEKATELGVHALAPLVTRRTVGAAREASDDGRLAKWRSTALEAAKQCGRARVPEVRASLRLDEALALEADLRLLLDPRAGALPLRERLASAGRPASVLALVGPEGGFTGEEVERAVAEGFVTARIGGSVLRIETAALALLAAVAVAWD